MSASVPTRRACPVYRRGGRGAGFDAGPDPLYVFDPKPHVVEEGPRIMEPVVEMVPVVLNAAPSEQVDGPPPVNQRWWDWLIRHVPRRDRVARCGSPFGDDLATGDRSIEFS